MEGFTTCITPNLLRQGCESTGVCRKPSLQAEYISKSRRLVALDNADISIWKRREGYVAVAVASICRDGRGLPRYAPLSPVFAWLDAAETQSWEAGKSLL